MKVPLTMLPVAPGPRNEEKEQKDREDLANRMSRYMLNVAGDGAHEYGPGR
jgi:hypothetical protein